MRTCKGVPKGAIALFLSDDFILLDMEKRYLIVKVVFKDGVIHR